MSPQHGKSDWSERRLDVFVGNLLRTGVLTAAVVVLMGGIIFLARHASSSPDYAVFQLEASHFRSVSGIVRGAFSGSGQGVIQLGFLLLIATPVMRVVLLLIGFTWQHDRLYMYVSFTVLTLLLFSLFGGRL